MNETMVSLSSLRIKILLYSVVGAMQEEAVKLGRIRVEGKMVAPSYVVRDSETMSHFVHRLINAALAFCH